MALTTLPAAWARLRASVFTSAIEEVRPGFARKTINETVNNSAVLQDDNELFVAVVANGVYKFEFRPHYTSGTTPDLKIGWSVPSGTTMVWGGNYADTSGGMVLNGNFAAGTSVAICGAGATAFSAVFSGVIMVSSTAGNFRLQWAQNTQTASDSIMLAGSYLHLVRVS